MTDDLFDTLDQKVSRRALEIWRSNQEKFPAFTRRMEPDDLDHVTGAWLRVYRQACEELGCPLLPYGSSPS